MSFWKKKKYCPYCGSELIADGSCPNKDCIKYTGDNTTTTTASTTTTMGA